MRSYIFIFKRSIIVNLFFSRKDRCYGNSKLYFVKSVLWKEIL